MMAALPVPLKCCRYLVTGAYKKSMTVRPILADALLDRPYAIPFSGVATFMALFEAGDRTVLCLVTLQDPHRSQLDCFVLGQDDFDSLGPLSLPQGTAIPARRRLDYG